MQTLPVQPCQVRHRRGPAGHLLPLPTDLRHGGPGKAGRIEGKMFKALKFSLRILVFTCV